MSRVITGKELRDQRVLRRMTQAQVALVVGVDQKTVANWESSRVPSTREDQVRDEMFFVDVQSLLGEVSDIELAAEVLRRMGLRTDGPPEDQWIGVKPPRLTRERGDAPESDA